MKKTKCQNQGCIHYAVNKKKLCKDCLNGIATLRLGKIKIMWGDVDLTGKIELVEMK